MAKPAPNVVASGQDSGSGTSFSLDLPSAPELGDVYIAHLSWIGDSSIFEPAPDTAADGWVRLLQARTFRGSGECTMQEIYRHTDDGSTTMDVTTDVSAALVATFHVIDAHFAGHPSAVEDDVQGMPQYGGDPRYPIGGTISPHTPAERLLSFTSFGGYNDGSALGAPAGPPTGYTYGESIISGGAHLHVAYRQTGITLSEDPGYSTTQLGGGTPPATGHGWDYAAYGTPENTAGSPDPGTEEFLVTPTTIFIWYEEYYPDLGEGDASYWGMNSGISV